ncbi:MAG: hypothetical protein ACE5FY_04090 [Nitrospiria bacterium]
MPAFNSRLKPRKIGHLPLYAVIGMLCMLITAVLTIVLQTGLKVVMMVLFGGFLFLTVFCFRVGDEISFFPIKLANKREKNRVTSETWTDA